MKKLTMTIASCAVLLLSSPISFANTIPKELATDSRMTVVSYNKNDVVTLVGTPMVATSVEFGENEVITDINGGDSVSWDAIRSKVHGNVMSIKPMVTHSTSNLTVITNSHMYHFYLTTPEETSGKPLKPVYNIRFIYPEEDAANALALAAISERKKEALVTDNNSTPADWNFDYSFSCKCSPDNVPIRAFDDGRFTYFQFADNHDNPAIFLVDGKGHESLANFHIKDKYVVIERTSPQFTIRTNGNENASCVFNDNYKA